MKKKLIIYISFIATGILLIFFGLFYVLLKSSFKINGNKDITIIYGQDYTDLGYDLKGITSKYITTENNIDFNKIGNYEVNYKLHFGIIRIKLTRNVSIIDNIAPVIELVSDENIMVCDINDYDEPGFKAYDNYDNDITQNVVVSQDENGNILYTVKDSSGNETSKTRKVTSTDIQSPNLSLIGNGVVYVKVGDIYQEKGYKVSDNCTKNVNVTSQNNVDTTQKGTYYYTYTAVDNAGNTSKISRKVVVYEPDLRPGSVYLTFDDGPSSSGSTSKILDILQSENVKATFFVTGLGSDDLILREYNEGHTILLHTYTHKWSIYTSVESYFDDLNKIASRVYNITGQSPKIIRFPGGSSNTVSNSYNYGIMNTLTLEVLNRGYDYIDWNVSSGDAGGCSASSCVYNNVISGLSKDRENIVLMHDLKWTTAGALENIIHYCKENNYNFYTISSDTKLVKFK